MVTVSGLLTGQDLLAKGQASAARAREAVRPFTRARDGVSFRIGGGGRCAGVVIMTGPAGQS